MYEQILKQVKGYALDLAVHVMGKTSPVGWEERDYNLIRGCLDALNDINKYSDFYGLREEIILILNYWDGEKWDRSDDLIYRCIAISRSHPR